MIGDNTKCVRHCVLQDPKQKRLLDMFEESFLDDSRCEDQADDDDDAASTGSGESQYVMVSVWSVCLFVCVCMSVCLCLHNVCVYPLTILPKNIISMTSRFPPDLFYKSDPTSRNESHGYYEIFAA